MKEKLYTFGIFHLAFAVLAMILVVPEFSQVVAFICYGWLGALHLRPWINENILKKDRESNDSIGAWAFFVGGPVIAAVFAKAAGFNVWY